MLAAAALALGACGESNERSDKLVTDSGLITSLQLAAQEKLDNEWGVYADVWSATSWSELRRDAVETDRHNFLHPAS